MKATIRITEESLKHIKDAADFVADDIAEMARRLNHPDGRKGFRARGLESVVGIH